VLLNGLYSLGFDDDVCGLSAGWWICWLLPSAPTVTQRSGGCQQAGRLSGGTDGQSDPHPDCQHRVPADRGLRARMVCPVGCAKRTIPGLGHHSDGSPGDRLQFCWGKFENGIIQIYIFLYGVKYILKIFLG